MGLEDYMEAPVGVAVAATAVLLSPRVRNVVRRGVVYGVAGAMRAADAATSAARTVAQEAQAAAPGDMGRPTAGAPTQTEPAGGAPPRSAPAWGEEGPGATGMRTPST
jgi:hypothetical protein